MRPVTSAAVARDAPDPAALARVIGRFVEGPVQVDGLRRFSGGASRETWAVDAIDIAGDVHRLVLRRDPPGQASAENRATEYTLLSAAGASGVPVPRVRALLAEDDGLARASMDRVDGETIPRRILRDANTNRARRLTDQAGTMRPHPCDRSSTAPPLAQMGAAADRAAARCRRVRRGSPRSSSACAVVSTHPPLTAPALVHGDFRNGNFIVGPDGIRAVLDWELAHWRPDRRPGLAVCEVVALRHADQIVGGFEASTICSRPTRRRRRRRRGDRSLG
jgi:aminoglycoside phosphotransferase (APT) family kinase protein